jgi:uncharacterized phage protein gp47/JayE
MDSSVLPVVVNTDLNTVRTEVSIYNVQYAQNTDGVVTYTNGGIVTSTQGTFSVVGSVPNQQNQFTISNISLLPSVQETIVQIIGRNYDPTATWAPSTEYALGYRFAAPNGYVQVVVQAGTSGATQPTWSSVSPATITNVAVVNNVATISAVGRFTVGQRVYLSGLTGATFLNGLVVTVLTVIGSGPSTFNGFTASVQHANYAPTSDTGTADATTGDNGVVWANFGPIAVTPTIKFNLIFFQSNFAVAIAPPSGITAEKNQTDCLLKWVTPSYPGFLGVRVMLSTDPAGINPPFAQFGDLVSDVTSTGTSTISSQTTTSTSVPTAIISAVEVVNGLVTVTASNNFAVGNVVSIVDLTEATFLNGEVLTIVAATPTSFSAYFTTADFPLTPDSGTATNIISTQVTTTTSLQQNINYSSVDVQSSIINNTTFYALFSTVVQDPTSNAIYESVQNGPLLCGFVNLSLAKPTDFPVLQRKEDIAGRLIGQITRQRPDLDLSPRSEIRDIFVDPFSIETANMSVREWFSRVSSSISAITQVDNTTGSGVSDPFQTSPYKQQIARAYGLTPQDTQNLIDEQFDLLGEQAGLPRLGSVASTSVATFYTYTQPQASILIPQGATVGTVADSSTAALNFTTLGQAVIDLSNLASFFNPTTGWWGVSVPVQCTTTGSIGNVGAGTIRQILSGVPAGINVTNLVTAQFGSDQESNSHFAARIQARLVTGVDTGTRHGYEVTALSTPGIVNANVVAAGDLDMLRDWDPIRQKHVFGTVDIYTQGTTLSEQDEFVPFVYQNTGVYNQPSTYITLTGPPSNGTSLTFQIPNFSSMPFPMYDGVELLVQQAANSFYLSLDRAQFDNVAGTITLNGQDLAYQYVGSSITKAKVPLVINHQNATNAIAFSSLQGAKQGTYTFQLFARFKSPFRHAPALQPIISIFSVTGAAGQTGSVPSNVIELVHTSDFLLDGGSQNAGDLVQIPLQSSPVTTTVTALTATPALIDTAMDVPLDKNGNPLDVLSVRSMDMSTLYQNGTDYQIVALSPYHTYGLQVLASTVRITQVQITNNVLTATAQNEFGPGASVTIAKMSAVTFLNGQVLTVISATSTQFTAAVVSSNVSLINETGTATGSAIQNNQQVLVSYDKFPLYERLSLVYQETQVLKGTLPSTLDNDAFVHNTWLPESYAVGIPASAPLFPSPAAPGIYSVAPQLQNGFALTLDGWDGKYGSDGGLDITGSTGLVGALVPHDSRYIKVTWNNGVTDVIMREGIDFTLVVDPVSGSATVARILTGHIPDGATVLVSYFINETLTVSTQYPAFVQILATQINQTKHAAADVLVKAMLASPVDVTLTVTLNANTAPETVDPAIRTAISTVLDNADTMLSQSVLVQQVQAITGVTRIELPLDKCAKSDGSYDVGVVVPTGTIWIPLAQDPAFAGLKVPLNSFITASPVLPDATIPSGGTPDAIVDLLYQGQVFRRAMSVQDFLANSIPSQQLASTATPGSFYIIGYNDEINPATPLSTSYAQKIIINVPLNVASPGLLSYFVTYQVFNQGGASDITVSSTEYLTPGVVTINYITGQ